MGLAARLTGAALAAVIACAAHAQDAGGEAGAASPEAELRLGLGAIHYELSELRRALEERQLIDSEEEAAATADAALFDALLERVSVIEDELRRVIASTEGIDHRLGAVAQDAANRITDLEFRLCELEEGCEVSDLVGAGPLGGGSTATDGAAEDGDGAEAPPQMAVGEQQDFNAALAALEAGNHVEAAEMFAAFRSTYPLSPLGDLAGIKRGEALEAAGDLTGAAGAYLDTFASRPDGPEAPEALFKVARTLGMLGKIDEACVTFSEVATRFPDNAFSADAAAESAKIGCR